MVEDNGVKNNRDSLFEEEDLMTEEERQVDEAEKVLKEETTEKSYDSCETDSFENESSESKDSPEGEELESEEKIDESEEEIDALKDRIQELEQEKEETYNRLIRLQADFDNYRKRVFREKELISFNTKIHLFDELLPVIDNFERALASFKNDDEYKKGVEMIYRQLLKMLDNQGVKSIPTVGETFDHNLHEAVMQVEDSDQESGTILEELQKGYMLEDRVIRPAMVKVAQ